ncbi:MAG: HAD-IIIA family hydrolase [Acidobacteria bacterium]|nr:HAD-IIIA family hydrolase [Acidobacteriota bacterium]
MTRAVCFDVDFTLIYPGPVFHGEGYRRFGARHGLAVDPAAFGRAVAAASALLDEGQDHAFDAGLFIGYIRRIIEHMGGAGPGLEACALEIYEEWAANQHFSLYDDVAPVLAGLARSGYRLGLISNTHRCLTSFQEHFDLNGLITAAISSSEHGYNKPHPSIFRTALRLLQVPADEAVMVGDNMKQDIEGARAVGMRAVLVCRSGTPAGPATGCEQREGPLRDVPVIRNLHELLPLL